MTHLIRQCPPGWLGGDLDQDIWRQTLYNTPYQSSFSVIISRAMSRKAHNNQRLGTFVWALTGLPTLGLAPDVL